MRKIGKSTVSLALALVLIMGLAAMTDGAQARYSNTQSIELNFSISNGMASCTTRVVGFTGTDKIIATAALYRVESNGSLTIEKIWGGITAYSDILRWTDSRAVYKGYTYRLEVQATVYRYGDTETVSISMEKKS